MPDLNEISRLIDEILQEEYEMCNQLFFGGFSQGGTTAIYTGLITSKVPFLGIFVLSSYIPYASFKIERAHIPIFIYHGLKDEIVYPRVSENMVSLFLDKFNFSYQTDSCLGHTYSWKEFLALKKWMENCLKVENI